MIERLVLMADIPSIIKNFREGTYVLPEFQRPFVWSKAKISELLDSIFNEFPIGAITTWTTSERILGAETMYNSEKPPETGLITYILDGQQRLKTLYYVFGEQQYLDMSQDGGKKSKYTDFYFYIDLMHDSSSSDDEKFINFTDVKSRRTSKNELAFIGYDDKKKVLLIHEKYKSLENGVYPLVISEIPIEEFKKNPDSEIRFVNVKFLMDPVFNKFSRLNLLDDYQADLLAEFVKIPVSRRSIIDEIKVAENMNLDKIAKIFGRINQSGVRLTVFDLLVALTWIEKKLNIRDAFDELMKINEFNDFFGDKWNEYKNLTQILSLRLHDSLSNKDQLKLKAKDFTNCGITVKNIKNMPATNLFRDSLSKTITFLKNHKVKNYKDIRYQRILHILTVINLEMLDKKGKLYKEKKLPNFNEFFDKLLEIFYWRVMFSSKSATGSNIPPQQLKGLMSLLKNQKNFTVKSINEINKLIDPIIESELLIEENDIIELQKEKKYKVVISQLIMYNNARNFETGRIQEWNVIPLLDKLEYHHIYPQKLLINDKYNIDESEAIIHFVGNFTPIPKDVNISIGKSDPHDYFKKFEKNYSKKRGANTPEDYDDVLKSHFIPDLSKLKSKQPIEKYKEFLENRMKLIRSYIKNLQQDKRELEEKEEE